MADEKEAWKPHMCDHTARGADTFIALQLGNAFLKSASENLCKDSAAGSLEQLVLVIATGLAIGGTIIESGSDEAFWETERVLKGIEERLMGQLRYANEMSRKHGMNPEKAKATFKQFSEAFGWPKQ
jgi:hypothetical protein